jgi:hypothetical protein
MATVHFSGQRYTGSDGVSSLNLSQPGDYEVSAEKAAQLVADFPDAFSLATPAKAPSEDEKREKVAESSQGTKADERAAEKSSKKAK